MQTESIVTEIIKEQSQIVGEYLAKYVATNSGVVTFKSSSLSDIALNAPEPKVAIQKLVDSYRGLFGQASVEVCMNVLKKFAVNDPSSQTLLSSMQ